MNIGNKKKISQAELQIKKLIKYAILQIRTEHVEVKLLGAGGGGVIYILCSPKKKKILLKKLSKYGNVDFPI